MFINLHQFEMKISLYVSSLWKIIIVPNKKTKTNLTV